MRALAGLGVVVVALVAGAGGAVGASGVQGHSIVVTGLGSVRTVPDRAQLSLGVSTDAKTAAGALRANGVEVAKVIAAIKGQGVAAADIRTEQVSLSVRYGDNGDAVVGYTATNSVSVVVRTLAKVGGVIDAAVEAGANQVSGPSLVRSDQSALYRQALRAAIGNARAKAQAIAKATGLTLRRITDVSESGGPAPLPVDAKTAAPSVGTPIEPGTQLVQATLTVTFAVG
ncbi:MAG TPA: SIMPL domain-containing protein [Gaiellaceae bacterium]|nr:SIMPL domain-containing protein [Gaiellaceae bacterium]